MPSITATAPGKVILFGEHAVVYGRPAIAAPVNQVRARVVISASPRSAPGRVLVQAPDVGLEAELGELPENHPLARAILGALHAFGLEQMPACTVRISSTIPVAAGLGSGASVSVALIRATAAFLGQRLSPERISALAYEVDKLYHGTPSGIDNTVIAYGLPVFFMRGQPVELLKLPAPFTLVIGDTGIQSPTSVAVGDLRRLWQDNPDRYEALFEAAGEIARAARRSIESGKPEQLGPLMNENQELLVEMGVSCPELERLVAAARSAGALGAKLSGGGRGGNMIALVQEQTAEMVAQALRQSGAVRTISTTVRLPAR
jgi:mevalonate kinase